MRYISWLLFIGTALEILSIILVTHLIGGGWTLILMILSIVCGITMLRNSGLSGLLLAFAAIRSGSNISLYQLLWPLRYVLAAVMLISPGFFSDIIAALLLLPISGKPMATAGSNTFQHQQTSKQNDIIEGEFTVEPNSDQPSTNKDKKRLPPE